jgi:HD-like signal output (HDOD) protein
MTSRECSSSSNKLLANLVGSVKDLPVLPCTQLALRQKLADSDASIREVVHIVEQDVAISAKILQLVNSAFFWLPREISSLRTAVGFLGIDTLQNLVLSAGVFTIFDPLAKLPGFSCEELQAHSQLIAKIAGQFSASAHMRGVAVVRGLLQDECWRRARRRISSVRWRKRRRKGVLYMRWKRT